MSNIKRTTLCYIEQNEEYLLIRKTKANDPNKDKYLGIGGHIEKSESPRDCIIREIYEETGITGNKLSNLRERGIVRFRNDIYDDEDMYLFTADFIGDRCDLKESCDEGKLLWYPKNKVIDLPIWEGDKIMFEELEKGDNIDDILLYKGEYLEKVIKNFTNE